MNSYNAIQIFVVSLKGEQLAIDFDANDTVEVLKAKIQTVEGTPVAEQNIVFAGKLLEDGHALAEYNLQKEATVQLTTAVEGGDNGAMNPTNVDVPILGAACICFWYLQLV